MRVLSSAATLKVKMARSTSMRAALMGLPASCASVRANSSLRSTMNAGDLAEDALAFEGRKAASGAERFDCGGNGGFGVLFAALRDSGDDAAVVGSADFDEIAVLLPAAIDEETVRRNRRDRHLCHFCLAPGEPTDFNYRTFRCWESWGGFGRSFTTGLTEEHWGKTIE